MAMRDEDFGATPTPTEVEDGFWSPPLAAPASERHDWQSLCEQAQARAETERARADAAEARCEELRRAEREARSRAGSLKWNLDKSRDKLKAAVEEVKEVRRAAKDALFFQAEVGQLEKLLSEAGVESSKRSTMMSLRKEVFRLRKASQKAVPAPRPGKDTVGELRGEVASLTRQVRELTRENARLSKVLERSQTQKDEIAALRRKVAALLGRLKRAAHPSPPRGRALGCARRWSARASRRTRSRRCAGKSVPSAGRPVG